MKIAFLNKYQNKVARGAETFVMELSKRLSKNHQVDVISDINYLSLFKKKYDVIIPTNGRWQVVIVRIITWLTGGKMIVSGQSGKGWDDRINLYTFPDVFIALSEYQKTWAKRANPFIKCVKIPNGVDLSKFTFKDRIFKGSRTLLEVGAFTKEKRHNLTIDAVARLKNVRLIITGSGGELKQVISNYGLKILGEDKFKILSAAHNQMPEIYKNVSALAFPTVPWESFGIVLVEAMASGLPVVATDDPIRREIVGNAGILVDPTDADAYAEAIEKVLEGKWSEKAIRQAKKYDWDIIANQYEKLLASFKE